MAAPRRSRSTVIVAMLVATLGLTALLAWEALQAARSHRATAENVLRDYSKVAAWEFARLGKQQLLTAMNNALGDVQSASKQGHIEAALGAGKACPSGCPAPHTILTAFRGSLADAQFTFTGAPVDDGVRTFLSRVADDGRRKPDAFTCPHFRMIRINDVPSVIVWRPTYDGGSDPTGVVGFITDPPFVTSVFEHIVAHTSLLPPSLVPAGAKNNAALSVRVSTPDGAPVFASATEWSPYEAAQQLTGEFDRLNLAVALRPEAAEGLVIGGLPRERLPLVIGLLTLTVGLVVVALVQLRREAELSRMRADFVSGVSHELRTPLAQIRMFSETLLLGRVRSPVEGRRSLEIIARETQRLIQLVENVLLFSRGERSEPTLAREAAALAPIVRDVVEGFAPLAAARQVRLFSDIDDGVSAMVDGAALRQVLLNLLDNAVKYGPAGQQVTIGLSIAGDRARISVGDEGAGVDDADADRIWEPFNRVVRVADATGGTGIGLSIVRQLTRLHGGRAWVERAPSGGARFIVELPGAWTTAHAATAVA